MTRARYWPRNSLQRPTPLGFACSRALSRYTCQRPLSFSYPFACLTAFLLYQRRLWASAIRARPSAVFGPVERPPWNLQRDLPRSTRTRQLRPSLVLAPHSGRSLTLEFHEAGEIRRLLIHLPLELMSDSSA